ncbi:galactokinase [Flavobacteriales bacterium]|nr:galactokinase [Flavobacteriales bacterium]
MSAHEHLFTEQFGYFDELQTYFCPGRVNLIGEHIDYLGGLVLPTAISLGITAVYRPNTSNLIRLCSTDFEGVSTFDLAELPNSKQSHWTDFVLGVILHLRQNNIAISGGDILFSSTLPKASGLSSSAALEVLCYYLFHQTSTGEEPNRIQMAIECQKIENEFIGVNCGIMDQFAVANGKVNQALMLDCNSVTCDFVPLNLGAYSLLIINSNKPRTLAESAYNQRRKECDLALNMISSSRPIKNLVDATEEDLKLLSGDIRKRTKHAYTEQLRVQESGVALGESNLEHFGSLMTESHISLRDDFEVSCTELDFIVNRLNESEYCLGARMTGAGFGGCCIALVVDRQSETLQSELEQAYENRFGFKPSFYSTTPSDGVHKVKL